MRVSVVIPTRDKADRLALVLRCLRAQTATGFELVIVDDGSADSTRDVAVGGFPGARIVPLSGRGRAAARNAGARAATGDLLLFLDDDIVVPPGLIAAHRTAHAVPGLALPIGDRRTGPLLVHGPLRELPSAARLLAADPAEPYAEADAGAFGRTVRNALERMVTAMATGDAPPLAPWLAGVGANMSLPRETWARAGGFDERYGTGWGCEDLEFSCRLYAAGGRTALAEDASGIHLSHSRPGRWAEHDTNFRLFAATHPDPAVAALPHLLSSNGSPARYASALADHHPIGVPG